MKSRDFRGIKALATSLLIKLTSSAAAHLFHGSLDFICFVWLPELRRGDEGDGKLEFRHPPSKFSLSHKTGALSHRSLYFFCSKGNQLNSKLSRESILRTNTDIRDPGVNLCGFCSATNKWYGRKGTPSPPRGGSYRPRYLWLWWASGIKCIKLPYKATLISPFKKF